MSQRGPERQEEVFDFDEPELKFNPVQGSEQPLPSAKQDIIVKPSSSAGKEGKSAASDANADADSSHALQPQSKASCEADSFDNWGVFMDDFEEAAAAPFNPAQDSAPAQDSDLGQNSKVGHSQQHLSDDDDLEQKFKAGQFSAFEAYKQQNGGFAVGSAPRVKVKSSERRKTDPLRRKNYLS